MKGKKLLSIGGFVALAVGLLWGGVILWQSYVEAERVIAELDEVLSGFEEQGWERLKAFRPHSAIELQIHETPIFPWQANEIEVKLKKMVTYHEQYKYNQREEYKWARSVVEKNLSDVQANSPETENSGKSKIVPGISLLEHRRYLKNEMIQLASKSPDQNARRIYQRISSRARPIAKIYEQSNDFELALAYEIVAQKIVPQFDYHKGDEIKKSQRIANLREKANRLFPEFIP